MACERKQNKMFRDFTRAVVSPSQELGCHITMYLTSPAALCHISSAMIPHLLPHLHPPSPSPSPISSHKFAIRIYLLTTLRCKLCLNISQVPDFPSMATFPIILYLLTALTPEPSTTVYCRYPAPFLVLTYNYFPPIPLNSQRRSPPSSPLLCMTSPISLVLFNIPYFPYPFPSTLLLSSFFLSLSIMYV